MNLQNWLVSQIFLRDISINTIAHVYNMGQISWTYQKFRVRVGLTRAEASDLVRVLLTRWVVPHRRQNSDQKVFVGFFEDEFLRNHEKIS